MDKKIKVAQIIGKAGNGGVEAYIFNYFKALDKDKFQFDFYVCGESKIIDKQYVETNCGKIYNSPNITNVFSYIKFLCYKFKENKYDIVQSNLNTLSFISLYAAKKAGIKIRIANSLSTSNKKEYLRNLIKIFLKLFSKTFATDYFACSILSAKWMFGTNIINSKNFYLVRNAIPFDDYTYNEKLRNEVRKKLNLNNKFVIGTVGRLEKQKNQIFLIDIFHKLKELDSNSKLVIIGEGKLKNELIRKISKFGLTNDVLILDSSATGVGKEMAKYYNSFDVFVLPSLYEGLPTVGIEAQINGLPCFFADNITRETQISNNAFFESLNDVPSLRAYHILNEKVFSRESLIMNKSDFDISNAVKMLEQIYKNLKENRL